MKKLFNAVTVLGLIIIAGGAGGYENFSTTFGVSLALMLSGVALTVLGFAGKEQYKKYRRRCLMLAKRKKACLSKADCGISSNFHKIGCNKEMKMV